MFMTIEKIGIVKDFDQFIVYIRDLHDPLPIARLIKKIKSDPRLTNHVKRWVRHWKYTLKKCVEKNDALSCFRFLEDIYLEVFRKGFRLVDERLVHVDKILDNLFYVEEYCMDCDYSIESYIIKFSNSKYDRNELIKFIKNKLREKEFICYNIHDLKIMVWKLLTEIQTEK